MFETLFLGIGAFMMWFWTIVGAITAAAGVFMLARRLAILPRAVRRTGEILRWERQSDSETPATYSYFPHVRFVDETGHTQEMRVDVGYTSEKYPPGSPYDVRFDPRDPRRAYTASLLWMLLPPLLLIGLGCTGLWVGLAGIFSAR